MDIYTPSYYSAFRCIAADCPDSCCQGWDVAVDDEKAAYYRALPGPLGDALREGLMQDDGTWYLENRGGRCPMWRQDGLCRIQAQLGEQALCRTCDQFPRLTHEYENFTERMLELSCPEAARLILNAPPEPPAARTDPDPDMALLLKTREEALAILRSCPPREAAALVMLLGCHVQQILDGGEETPFRPEQALAEAKALAKPGGEADFIAFFLSLEILTEQWPRRLSHPTPAPWQEGHAALCRYLVSRYWLQAYSDGDLYGRAKLIISLTALVQKLGGDLISTAQLMSKELENDPENIDAILDGAYQSPALADDRLLGLILK